ncbi:hypothetical protein C8039_12335 [Halogeometricum sp. wsp3]|nr:hypothetical protein C8039_12335 [Halogeometricum sp. wsp3]
MRIAEEVACWLTPLRQRAPRPRRTHLERVANGYRIASEIEAGTGRRDSRPDRVVRRPRRWTPPDGEPGQMLWWDEHVKLMRMSADTAGQRGQSVVWDSGARTGNGTDRGDVSPRIRPA